MLATVVWASYTLCCCFQPQAECLQRDLSTKECDTAQGQRDPRPGALSGELRGSGRDVAAMSADSSSDCSWNLSKHRHSGTKQGWEEKQEVLQVESIGKADLGPSFAK